ncbi:TrmH family RNA methyltransferase, partial [Streptomyces diastaticus]|uniref:TrmH family RNA methyltransferase n=1 Tax=Streptomyces diastaticus TaxID=1956 RepID=UPI003666FC81
SCEKQTPLAAYNTDGVMGGALAAAGAADVTDLPALDGPVAIVVGSEGKGLSRLVGETCDIRVRIPMPGGAESLNAGVAAGIVLYEAARRRA